VPLGSETRAKSSEQRPRDIWARHLGFWFMHPIEVDQGGIALKGKDTRGQKIVCEWVRCFIPME
jgi:hypothetical protein